MSYTNLYAALKSLPVVPVPVPVLLPIDTAKTCLQVDGSLAILRDRLAKEGKSLPVVPLPVPVPVPLPVPALR